MGRGGIVREVTAAGVVVVSTGSGSLRLREKGGLYVFIFAFLFHFYLSYLPLCFLTSIHPSSYIHSPLPIYFCTSFILFIYLPIRSASLLSVFLILILLHLIVLFIYPSLYVYLYLSERMNVCLLVCECVWARTCAGVCVRACVFPMLILSLLPSPLEWIMDEREKGREGKGERILYSCSFYCE